MTIRFCLIIILLLFVPRQVVAEPLQVLASVHKRRPPATVVRNVSSHSSRSSLLRYLSAKSALVMDADTGEILFARNPDVPRQPASTIKILTGLIALDTLKKNDKVTVSRRAARMPRSKVDLQPGKWYWANDLINAVLLASANDASVALAEKVCGSERKFAGRMTETARRLGAGNTVCRTASGLTARGQHSTARDLALMFDAAMENREFARRIARPRVRTGFGRTLVNHNKALWRIRGAVGGKTGYTRAARQTYVGKFQKGDRQLVVAIMGSESMWDDISRLVRYGFARLRNRPRPTPENVEERLVRLRNQLHRQHALQTVQVLTEGKKLSPNLSL